MHFQTLLPTILALAANTLAAPTGEAATSPNIFARDNSKLNQYNHPECKDDNGSNVPTYHAAPPMYKCYNIDSTTESFFWNLGPLTYLWAYKQADCAGGDDFDQWTTLAGYDQSGCQPVNTKFKYEGGDERILSIMMH